jgi:uncharacterized protein
MTPEERELVRGLFDRLSALERERRDPDAERLIREGLARAPNAPYSMVQTVLLQDEALRAANARIEELERELEDASPVQPRREESFLGSARSSASGGGASKWNTGSVLGGGPAPHEGRPPAGGDRPAGLPPSFGSGSDRPMGVPPGFGRERDYPGDAYGQPMRQGPGGQPYGGPAGGPPYGGPGGPAGGPGGGPQGGPGGGPMGGGSFLGTAAAIAAGVIGGGLLMGGIKSALGGQAAGGANPGSGSGKSPFADAFEQLTGGKPGGGSSSGSPSGSGDLARDAGLNDIGSSQRQSAWGAEDSKNEKTDDDTNYGEDNADYDDEDYEDEDEEYEDEGDDMTGQEDI